MNTSAAQSPSIVDNRRVKSVTEQEICEALTNFPGATLRQLCDLLICSYGGLDNRMNKLVKAGKVNKVLNSEHGITPFNQFWWVEGAEPTSYRAPYSTNTTREKHRSGIKPANPDVITALRNELTELRRWKQDAIDKYPDLAVSIELLEGRKILRKVFASDQHKITDINSGALDESPIMKAILLAREWDK